MHSHPKSIFILPLFLVNFCLAEVPKLTLEELIVNHKKQTPGQSINLVSLNNDLKIRWQPWPDSTVRYRYILHNYEMDTTTVLYPQLRYMQLPQGKYVLELMVFKGHNKIASKRIPVYVEHAINEQWWFIPLLMFCGLLIVLGGIYLFFLYNFRQKIKVQKLRNKIAADLHDEVGYTLNAIGMSSKILQNMSKTLDPDFKKILRQIHSDSEETITQIRDTVWTLNTENDTLEQLTQKIKSSASQLFDNKGIVFTFEANINEKIWPKINIETRKNIYFIIKESLNNIAKHAQATKAAIYISEEKDSLILAIKDNGCGFDFTKNYDGNGLKNFKKRAKESLLELEIKSIEKVGTEITILIPFF